METNDFNMDGAIPSLLGHSYIDVFSPWLWYYYRVGGAVRQTGQTKVHLLTGGKGKSQRQNLFRLTCGVQAYDPLPTGVGSWLPGVASIGATLPTVKHSVRCSGSRQNPDE